MRYARSISTQSVEIELNWSQQSLHQTVHDSMEHSQIQKTVDTSGSVEMEEEPGRQSLCWVLYNLRLLPDSNVLQGWRTIQRPINVLGSVTFLSAISAPSLQERRNSSHVQNKLQLEPTPSTSILWTVGSSSFVLEAYQEIKNAPRVKFLTQVWTFYHSFRG